MMATITATGVCLAHQLALFPAPLHVRKRTRKSTFHRLTQRKPTHLSKCGGLDGPLDDIIDEITGNIWRLSPRDESHESRELSFLDWPTTLKLASPWSVAPLPVSRIPSNQPLVVRKTRRSTASNSTVSDKRVSSQDSGEFAEFEFELNDGNPYRSYSSSFKSPFASTATASQSAAQQQLSTILEATDNSTRVSAPQLQRKRFLSLSNTIEKLCVRSNTNNSARKNPSSSSSISSPRLANELPCAEMANRYWSSLEYHPVSAANNGEVINSRSPISTIAAAVRVLPEIMELTQDKQTFWASIEIEGVLHNRRTLSNNNIDIIFVIDNAYYMTEDCLSQTADLVKEALYHLKKGDRLALYTTCCIQEAVARTIPKIWHPLEPVDTISIKLCTDMIANICTLATQTWEWPQTSSPMDEALAAVAKSFEHKVGTLDRTHVVLFSLVRHGIQEVSELYPFLHFHQINPAILPFCKNLLEERECSTIKRCDNVTTINYNSYQCPSNCLRQLFQYARSADAEGAISNIHIDLHPRSGCEVVKCEGSTEVPNLRLGEIHSLFAQIKVVWSEAQEMDLASYAPNRDASLARNNLCQDLQNAAVRDDSTIQPLSVQIIYKNSLLPSAQWCFTETPLVVFKGLGRMSRPIDQALEAYKRRIFRTLSRLEPELALEEVDNLYATVMPGFNEPAKKILNFMAKEIKSHMAIIEHDKTSRQNLPFCPRAIIAPPAHNFLVEKWGAIKKG